MKKIIILLTLLCITACAANSTASKDGNTFTDSRDGKRYKVVKIGTQTWMAENLNYAAKGSKCGSTKKRTDTDEDGNKSIGFILTDDNTVNCDKYGRLYDFEIAIKACPSGWHLPGDKEWDALIDFAGGEEIAKIKLMAKSGWNDYEGKSISGEDKFGFFALPGGLSRDIILESVGYFGIWWGYYSDGIHSYHYAIGSSMEYSRNSNYYGLGGGLFSVRCLYDDEEYVAAEKVKAEAKEKVEAIRKANGGSTFTDTRDKKTYKTAKIGEQVWMAENLNYNAKGSKCYDNKESNCNKYGRLYDWNTAMKTCPKGWHLPSNEEWNILLVAVGGEETAGKYLKAKYGWSDSGNGEDKFGFSALPGGHFTFYYGSGGFGFLSANGIWWSASEDDGGDAYGKGMDYRDEHAGADGGNKSNLYSVRCLRD
jgi:uncharacterized protein (TIGR02145 family)